MISETEKNSWTEYFYYEYKTCNSDLVNDVAIIFLQEITKNIVLQNYIFPDISNIILLS